MAGRVQTIGRTEIGNVFGARAVNFTERRAEVVKEACQEECPVKTGLLRSQHKVIQIGRRNFAVLADTDYASHVHDGDGPEGPRRPNRWMNRGVDKVAARNRGR